MGKDLQNLLAENFATFSNYRKFFRASKIFSGLRHFCETSRFFSGASNLFQDNFKIENFLLSQIFYTASRNYFSASRRQSRNYSRFANIFPVLGIIWKLIKNFSQRLEFFRPSTMSELQNGFLQV